MKAISENAKNIVFHQGNVITGRLTFARWRSYKASFEDQTNYVFNIGPTNIFKNKFNVVLDQHCLLTIHRKWTGAFKIRFSNDSEGQQLIFSQRGFIKIRYVLRDKDERTLAKASMKYRWKRFRHDFEIEMTDILKRKDNSFLLVAVMVYLMRIKLLKAGY